MDTTTFKFKNLETALADLTISVVPDTTTDTNIGRDDALLGLGNDPRLPQYDVSMGLPSLSRYTNSKLRSINENDAYFEACELDRVELRNCILRKSTIMNAMLIDCTLFGCRLYNTNVKQSQLTSCIVGKGVPGTSNSSYMFCRLSRCCIEYSKISAAIVTNGLIQCCSEIWNAELHRMVVHSCDIINTTVARSGLSKSALYECKLINNSIRDSEVTTSPLAFRKFPTEVRQIIFREALEGMVYTSELIVALRGDPQLYFEILEVLGKTCFFKISPRNEESRKSMALDVYKNIQNLSLCGDIYDRMWPPCETKGLTGVKHFQLTGFKFIEYGPYMDNNLVRKARQWTSLLGTLVELSVRYHEKTVGKIDRFIDAAKLVSKGLGVKGKAEQDEYGITTWTWKASKGETLIWDIQRNRDLLDKEDGENK